MNTEIYKFKPRDSKIESLYGGCKRNIISAIEYLSKVDNNISFIYIRTDSSYENLLTSTCSWYIIFKNNTKISIDFRYFNYTQFTYITSDLDCFNKLSGQRYNNQSCPVNNIVDEIIKTDNSWVDLGFTDINFRDFFNDFPKSNFRVLVNIKKLIKNKNINLFNFSFKGSISFRNFAVNSDSLSINNLNVITFRNLGEHATIPIFGIKNFIKRAEEILINESDALSTSEKEKLEELKDFYSSELKNKIYNNENIKTIFYKYIADEIFQVEKLNNNTKKAINTVKEKTIKAEEETKKISDELHLLLEISDEDF